MELTAGEIVSDVFSGLAILPALGLGISCVLHLNNGKDPVRSGFRWLSSAAFCLFIYATLYLTFVLIASSAGASVSPRVYTHLGAFTNLAYRVLNILLLIVIVKLGAGHLSLWDQAPRLRRGAVYAAYALGAIIGALSLATSIVQQVIPVRDYGDFHRKLMINSIWGSIEVVFFVAFAAALALSIYVLKVGRMTGHKTKTPCLCLVASVLIFLCTICGFASACFSFTVPTGLISQAMALELSHKSVIINLVSTVVDFTATPAAVAVLYIAGKLKVGGLWSTGVQRDSGSDAGKERGQV